MTRFSHSGGAATRAAAFVRSLRRAVESQEMRSAGLLFVGGSRRWRLRRRPKTCGLTRLSLSCGALAVLTALAAPLYSAAIINDPAFQAQSEDRNDDGSTPAITLPFALNFFGQTFSQIYVNTNGNITFTAPLAAFTAAPIVSNSAPLIAAYWADWDTRPTSLGQVTYGTGTVDGHQAFGIDWINIGYFDQHTDKTNSAQLILIDRSDTGAGNFDIELNYDQIQWESGDASGGIDGLGGSSARAGYTNGSDHSFELPGSAVNGAFLDGGPNSLTGHAMNANVLGRYLFESRNGSIPEPTGVVLFLCGGALLLRLRRDPTSRPEDSIQLPGAASSK